MDQHGRQDDTSSAADLRISLLTPADWRVLAQVRLTALADSPEAFAANGDESDWRKADWRRTFQTGLWVMAHLETSPVGLAQMSRNGVEPPHIESVWTDRAHRRKGVARAMVQWLVDREQQAGADEILVWVIDPNPTALLLYASLGFESTGERQVLENSGERIEERLRLRGAPKRDA
jgi:predicted GNAT family acetyltransferase